MPVLGVVSGSPSAPKQHNQPSRKGRKAWRKNVDVSEVEKGLEERNKEIIEGKVIKEQASQALFRVAVEKDSEIERQIPRKFKKILKSEEIIAARSAVPAVAQRKRGGDVSSKTTDGVLSAKRQRTNYVSQKELARLRKVADGYHDNTVAIVEATYDPWAITPDDDSLVKKTKGAKAVVAASAGDATKPAADGEDPFSFLPKPQKVKAPETLKHPPISLAANGKPVPAVAKPNGSFSYNPAFGDYEARLTEEGRREVEAEKKRLAAAEAERIRLEAVARSAAEAEEAEARAEMSEWEEDSAWEGFESGAEGGGGEDEGAEDGTTAAKRPKRKTPAQRNRINRRKEVEGQKKHEAAMRHKQEQIKRMELILAEAATEALAENDDNGSDADEDDEQEDMGDDSVLRRRQLGKFRLPEKDLELVLPDELQDSLRLLKPEGNLLKDRYRNLLVRGKMEARRKRPFRKQAKTKQTEKWAHKDFLLF